MLLQPCCPTPRARREAELPRKHARQVTLVGETGLRRRRREGNAVTNQHPRTLGAAAQQPRVGREPIGSLESAQNLIAAQPRELGQVCETRHARRIVGETLADLLEVRGWRIAPPRRAMPRHQAYATCDQRFLECQGIHRSRVWRAIVPALETDRKSTRLNSSHVAIPSFPTRALPISGQVCETRHARRIVGETLADLLEVRGWRIAPPRRAMPRHQAYATCDQRFLECQGIHRSRVWRAIVPALE